MANPLIKPIKEGLSKIYGYKNVSVRNGQGTAWGWVEIKVKTDYEDGERNEGYFNKSREIEHQAVEILQKAGLKPYTFTADDGYYTEHNDILVQVERLSF